MTARAAAPPDDESDEDYAERARWVERCKWPMEVAGQAEQWAAMARREQERAEEHAERTKRRQEQGEEQAAPDAAAGMGARSPENQHTASRGDDPLPVSSDPTPCLHGPTEPLCDGLDGDARFWEVSVFRPYYSVKQGRFVPGVRPEPRRVDWPRLQHTLTTFRRYDTDVKEELPAWSPAIYPPGATRSKANVSSVSCLVLDYDDGTPIDAARETWSAWPHILHTTWSHGPGAPRFRVVLPLEEPIPARHWGRVWAWAHRQAPRIDAQCCDASRLYYLPAWRGDHDLAIVHDEPSCLLRLDPELLPPTDEERRCRETRGHTEHGIKRRSVPPGRVLGGQRRRLSVSPSKREKRRILLNTDPAIRARAGEALGGRVVDEWVRGVVCPKCGRASVWWALSPRGCPQAFCNHRNTCGWRGGLYELLEAAP